MESFLVYINPSSILFQLQQPVSQNIFDLIQDAGLVAKAVLAILFVFSVISWAIILQKWRVFRRLNRESREFLQLFKRRRGLRDIYQKSRKYSNNPFAAVFREAYWFLLESDSVRGESGVSNPVEMLREQKSKSRGTSEDLIRIFDSAATSEILQLEKYLGFLATTGSVSPFFGLFGTVWGVMSAFLSIAYTGSSDLSVVAPGIAEALITTVAGLGAAIPAVIAYNYFVNKIKHLSAEIETFSAELLKVFLRKEIHEVRQ